MIKVQQLGKTFGRIRVLDNLSIELAAGQATLQTMMIFPAILIVLFVILFYWVRKTRPVAVAH